MYNLYTENCTKADGRKRINLQRIAQSEKIQFQRLHTNSISIYITLLKWQNCKNWEQISGRQALWRWWGQKTSGHVCTTKCHRRGSSGDRNVLCHDHTNVSIQVVMYYSFARCYRWEELGKERVQGTSLCNFLQLRVTLQLF